MASKRAKKNRAEAASPLGEGAGAMSTDLQMPVPPERRALHYKVVELSSVDEHTVERTINEWVPMGWKFDGLQFAMRESSKRPSMAFVFFTREGAPLPAAQIVPHLEVAHRSEDEALAHLQKLTAEVDPMQTAWERLHGMTGTADTETTTTDQTDQTDPTEPEES